MRRFSCRSLLKFRDADGKDSLLEKSLFQQEIIKRGVLLLATSQYDGGA